MYFVELVLKCIKAGGLDIYTEPTTADTTTAANSSQ